MCMKAGSVQGAVHQASTLVGTWVLGWVRYKHSMGIVSGHEAEVKRCMKKNVQILRLCRLLRRSMDNDCTHVSTSSAQLR